MLRRLRLSVKSKIWLSVLSVVLMFAIFILIYFPAKQEQYLLQNYNEEVQNFANTVALGVKIALTEQNFEGVETAIDFVRNDERLKYVSLVQTDTLQKAGEQGYDISKTIFKTIPDGVEVDVDDHSSDLYIVKTAPFISPIMSGEVMLSFSTREILLSRKQIRITSVIASLVVFLIGLVIGYWLAKNISKPVLALRDAARRVGEGDLTQSVTNQSNDEIGELGIAFNKMVKDLSIESALEKVRRRTMAMQHSNELIETSEVLFQQLQELGAGADQISIGIINEEKGVIEVSESYEGKKLEKIYDSPIDDQPILKKIYGFWKSRKKTAVLEITGDELKAYNAWRNKFGQSDFSDREGVQPLRWVINMAFFSSGVIFFSSHEAVKDETMHLLERFTQVFEQTYTRFQDLKKAEAQAFEALKRSSLDRVRGEIASMRSKEDLKRITPVIWKELKTLEVPFIRCGVFIVNDEDKTLKSFLSNPDGDALGIFDISIDATSITKSLVSSWRKNEAYMEHWEAEDFVAWTKTILELGHIESQQSYQGAAQPPQSLDLHFVPFKQGMLYVGDISPLSDEHLELVSDLSQSFSIAYSRFEDFVSLEKAKQQTENTLSELRSTQSQLVHAEKMASLGELTAGIAHEIQNPLNFVNNFSDVSGELIEELKAEREKLTGERDKGLEEEILNDITQNLEKINHHGQRASDIVKGMLQHSRGTSDTKEATDINKLVDEYLRLAYHGLRAKDKSFNADFKTEFDETLPKINVIPQDIGRVLLNLINNAFYAVSQKAEAGSEGYKPTVTVSTKHVPLSEGVKGEEKILISISDNGIGIPEQVRDKIFQPFFTTKPTGQGTGLGLSMSYDIVTKGHGGELKVKSNEARRNDPVGRGEGLPVKPDQQTGTEFVVELPIV